MGDSERPVAQLRELIRRVRENIEARGVEVDGEVTEQLMTMMTLGREAIEAGLAPHEYEAYKGAAEELDRLVQRKKKAAAAKASGVPTVSFRNFYSMKKQVDDINMRMRRMRTLPHGIGRLVELANTKAKSEHEFKYFLKEIDYLLRS
jgi:murein L,D-transpeptidase YcbB/YkuD